MPLAARSIGVLYALCHTQFDAAHDVLEGVERNRVGLARQAAGSAAGGTPLSKPYRKRNLARRLRELLRNGD